MTAAPQAAVAELARRLLTTATSVSGLHPVTLQTARSELERALGSPAETGAAFGVPWPYWRTAAGIVAPGLPAVVTDTPREAAGGAYRRLDDTVLREALGIEQPVLDLATAQRPPETPFDLLWFAAEERRTVADGWLRFEDLFSTSRVPATRVAVAGALSECGHPWPDRPELERPADGPATIAVGRPSAVVRAAIWSDPVAVVAGRGDVERVEACGERLSVLRGDGREVSYEVATSDRGWRLFRVAGDDPYAALELTRDEEQIRLTARPDEQLDLTRVAVRRRLAFDMTAVLVRL